jgi:2-(1,2-epoxy-1,2-dihydrophenyl)acetyl-CoA isomerase
MSRTQIQTATEQCLAYEEDGVAVVTLNRPQARNALTKEMLAGLERALDHAERTDSIRALLLTGAGGAFCAGGDVKNMAAGPGEDAPSVDQRVHNQRLSQRNTAGRMFTMPKPVIAMLPGPAAGAGLALALAADLRTMADSAFITTAFARVGFSGDYGGTFFLSHLVGLGKAKELYFLSERLSAVECKQLGIANFVFRADHLEEQTLALARRLAAGPSVAYRYMKENLNRAAMGADVMQCLDLEVTHHVHTGLTEDHRNATQAFVDKREPVFKGR